LIELLQGWLPTRLAVTMTGELCDCFETKRDGVRRILAEIGKAFPAIPIGVWSTAGRFVTAEEARQKPLSVAAANWHALATIVGSVGSIQNDFPTKLLIDVGSTTSDIIPVINGKPATVGLTDTDRLRSKELVYTGTRRTPICALLQEGIAAEFFATTLDVYLRLGLIADDFDNCQTADGRPATAKHAYGRLAHMIGGDPEITSDRETHQLAVRVFEKQRSILADAFRAVIDRMPNPPEAVVLSGSGEFLARAAWQEFAADTIPVCSLKEVLGASISSAACAYAVAVLAEKSWPI
jgi:(4-(4-[2-(gamma-L-glutamylamino)ethyl]phenoxymethyl)furan-2-yl)methanamine synthase